MKHLIALLLLTVATVPAYADLQMDIMNDKINRLDREMTLLQKKIYGSETTTPRRQTPVGENIPADGIGELYGQLDAQNAVIEDLTRRTEELSYEVEQLREQLKTLSADVDVRFKTLPAPTVVVPAGTPAVPQKKPDIPKLEKADKDAYDAAYDLLKKGKYAAAEAQFTAFIKDYPDSALVGNANYWLGETYYVRGQYDVAAGIFSDGLTKYEKNSKAPDNLLKLGMTMGQLKKKTEACGFLTLLPEKFPKASDTLKKRARAEADKLACPK